MLESLKDLADRENLHRVRIYFAASVVCSFLFFILMFEAERTHRDFFWGRFAVIVISAIGYGVSFIKPTPHKWIRWILTVGVYSYIAVYLYLLTINDWSVFHRWSYFVVVTILATTAFYWKDFLRVFIIGSLAPIFLSIQSSLGPLVLVHFLSATVATLYVVGLSVQANFRYREKVAKLTEDLTKNTIRIQEDLKAARDIQRSLLPAFDHDFGGFKMEILYQPAEDLSGDFFEIRRLDEDNILFYVADVTSHGTPAAQVTYLLKGIFENVTSNINGPPLLTEIARRMANAYIAYGLEYSICLGLGRLDIQNRKLDFLSSGLPEAQLIRGKQFFSFSTPMNPMIDKMAAGQDLVFKMESQILSAGDSFYLFTDGAIELMDSKQNRMRSERDLVRTLVQTEGQQWRQDLLQELRTVSASEKFPDDVTILRIHFNS